MKQLSRIRCSPSSDEGEEEGREGGTRLRMDERTRAPYETIIEDALKNVVLSFLNAIETPWPGVGIDFSRVEECSECDIVHRAKELVSGLLEDAFEDLPLSLASEEARKEDADLESAYQTFIRLVEEGCVNTWKVKSTIFHARKSVEFLVEKNRLDASVASLILVDEDTVVSDYVSDFGKMHSKVATLCVALDEDEEEGEEDEDSGGKRTTIRRGKRTRRVWKGRRRRGEEEGEEEEEEESEEEESGEEGAGDTSEEEGSGNEEARRREAGLTGCLKTIRCFLLYINSEKEVFVLRTSSDSDLFEHQESRSCFGPFRLSFRNAVGCRFASQGGGYGNKRTRDEMEEEKREEQEGQAQGKGRPSLL